MAVEERTEQAPAFVPGLEIDKRLLKQCVHCGLCLDACPTYRLLGVEMDSPRGRIYQARMVYEGKVSAQDPHFREHIYACLDCRACETACPSGVQYGKIVEAARAAAPPPTLAERTVGRGVLNTLFTSNLALDAIGLGMRLYQKGGVQTLVRKSGLLKLVPPLAKLEAMMPPIQGGIARVKTPTIVQAQGERRARVAFLSGCVMPQFMGETNAATVRVLAANGCDVVTPPEQKCCGALHGHTGDREAARELARHNIAVFERANPDAIIVNAAGCGSMMKEYGHLLEDDPAWAERAAEFSRRCKDIAEFLAALGLRTETLGRVDERVTYQDACHLVHGQGVRNQPRELLRQIPGLELVEMSESDTCCGSAGIYNLTHPTYSSQILEWKMDSIQATGVGALVVDNPGCTFQILSGARKRGMDLRLYHLVDLLDRAYRAGSSSPGE
jgi:glycolate oxidase iron-sulfur subunit